MATDDMGCGAATGAATCAADDERFMREALAQARLAASLGEVPIGAVVVRDGEVVARAHNRRELDEDPSAHAEFSALMAASRELGRWRLPDCTVYVTLEPCAMCAGLMVNARVGRCVYGARDAKAGALGSLYRLHQDARLNHGFAATAGVLERECAALLSDFFADLRVRRRARGANGASVERGGCGCATSAVSDRTAEDALEEGLLGMKRHEEALDRAVAEGISPVAARVKGGGDPAPHVLLAVDSFKGSATSAQVEALIAEGVRHVCPSATCECLPIADGGEGTVEAVRAALGGAMRKVEVAGPLGGRVQAGYLLSDAPGQRGLASTGTGAPSGAASGSEGAAPAARRIAVIEMAAAAGITLSDRTHEHALAASTAGVGELVLDAVGAGAAHIYIGLGGSCTNDGGAGFLRALGARLLDAAGAPVQPGLAGLDQVDYIDLAPALEALRGVQITSLTDVTNPLVGTRGALAVFGSQKGLCAHLPDAECAGAIRQLDQGMIAYAQVLDRACAACSTAPAQPRFRSVAGVPGAGAAGGLGAALLAVGARLTGGIESMLDLIGFDAATSRADLVITGEGRMDSQTAAGKAPVGVAKRAKRAGLPVVAVVGGRAQDLDAVYAKGVDLVLSAPRAPMPLERALTSQETRVNLACAGESAIRAYLMGR